MPDVVDNSEVAADFERVQEALDSRWPENRIDPSLERIQALVDLLGSPQRAYPVIHLTGTNGKTTTARMIESLLRSFGLRTGRLTSPHLVSITERIAIDGEPISARRFVEAYDDISPYVEMVDTRSLDANGVPLSYFEVLTAMAYAVFADTPVDVAIVEVGMGGTWDSTNVADGQVAVITPIDLDHTHYLGDTVTAIAREKAGIIKPSSTAVIAKQQESAAQVLLSAAAEVDAVVAMEGAQFAVLDRTVAVDGQLLSLQGLSARIDDVFVPLHGAHQAQNAACALAAVEAFFGLGADKAIDADAVRRGFADVRSPGRLEVLRSSPTVIIDAAHNPHGVRAAVSAVSEAFAFTRLVGVVAALADKDVAEMLRILAPALHSVVVTENSSHRRLDVDSLAALAVDAFGEDRVAVEPRLSNAIDTAIELAEEDIAGIGSSGVLIIGSVITAGDACALLSDE
jgi:dihydrofolate synthase/folylpolyglutamate synthase